MMENSNIYWSNSDKSIQGMLGKFIRDKRVGQHKTQQELAVAAGVNRSTVIKIEDGESVTLASFIQLVRALGELEVFRNFEVKQQVSPLLMAAEQMASYKRVRKSGKSGGAQAPKSDW